MNTKSIFITLFAISLFNLTLYFHNQNQEVDTVWNTVHTKILKQNVQKSTGKVLNRALSDIILYSEYELYHNQSALNHISENNRGPALLRRLRDGERDTLILPVTELLYAIKTWYPDLDPNLRPEEYCNQFLEKYEKARKPEPPNPVSIRQAFDEAWAQR